MRKETKTPGIWDQWTADKYHQSSPSLARWIADYLNKNRVVLDFGCGNAYYLSKLAEEGFQGVGIEGYKLNNFLFDNVYVFDLSKPLNLEFKGSVISLEVGEHIPKEGEQNFLDTVTNHCDSDLIFSWALPGQPGVGHINCQPQDYIISEVERRGFTFLPIQTQDARDNVDENCDWFRRTLLIFKRNG